jgi:putative ABC transport system permease protein
MFKNYLVSAYRNVIRSKLDSVLNISGLVIGLSAALVIALFIQHEQSYDDFWSDSGRTFRIQTRWVMQGRDDIEIVHSAGPVRGIFESYYGSDLETVARLQNHRPVISTGSESFSDLVTFVDPEILDIFDFEVLEGDAKQALADNSSIVLTETLAKKYFGDDNPINKVLTLENRYLKRDLTVRAVIRDMPQNTHLNIQSMIKIDETDYADNQGSWMFSSWNAANNHTYFKLPEGSSIERINSRISEFTDAMVPDDDGKASVYTKFSTLAVPDIHLRSIGAGSLRRGGDSQVVLAFAIIAVLIVVVATINYVNLSTARSGQRAREIAMRKVVGAKRGQLITQHLGESLLIVGFAIMLAVIVVEAMLPIFNQAMNLDLKISLADPVVSGGLILALFVVGGLSGVYPAVVLSSYSPASALRASTTGERGGMVRARNILVIFQTAITVSLIVATAVVYAQLTFFRTLDRGFEMNGLMVVEGMQRPSVTEKDNAFQEEVTKLPGVAGASLSYEAPTKFKENNIRVRIPGESEELSYPLGTTYVDYEYLNVLKIPLVAGRYYQRERALDHSPSTDGRSDGDVVQGNIVINEKAVTAMGMGTPAEAIGREILTNFSVGEDGTVLARLTIIGVIGDTNLHSVKIPVRPETYVVEFFYDKLLVRYSGDSSTVLSGIESIWSDIMGDEPFEYFHVDQALADEFQSEVSQANIFLGFAVLTMFIGCLGLYGLAAFVTERRRKEIGIRKILGANIRDILSLLLSQFSRLVLVANLIAWPIAYLLMTDWLQQYPFRISGLWIATFCVAAGFIASFVVALTVGSQAWGVARANPIHAIRQE